MTIHDKMQACSQAEAPAFSTPLGDVIPDPQIMATGKVDASIYYSPEQFEIEKEIFRNSWIYAGRIEDIAQPGDWLVKDVELCAASVIVMRQKDGGVRAFHNVCRHRGMKLLWTESGHGGVITCPYHAWSYNADGGCRAMTDPGAFPDVDRREMNLAPVDVDNWNGFLFINLTKEPRQTLRDYLGPVADRFDGAPFEDFPCSATVTATLDANWKLGADASCEAYHVQALHAKSCKPWVAPSYNPFVHFLGWQPLGAHRMTSIPINREFALDPQRPVQMFAWSNMSNNVVSGDGSRPEGGFADHPDINPLGADDWANDAYYLFPTTSIYAASNGWFIQQYLPISVNRTLYTSTWFYPSPKNLREEFALIYSNVSNRDITTEDLFAVKGQHDGIVSGAIEHLHFGEGEIINRHIGAVMKAVTDAYRANGAPIPADA